VTAVETNLTGLMYGCSVAAKRMLAQGGGFIYNLEGFGSTGMLRRGMSVYGSTKAAVHYFTRALAKDLEGTPVKAASVAPGMVMTDLVAGEYVDRPAEWESAKRIFNIIADNVETVAPWMAQQVLANERNGARIAWLTPAKLAWRFASARFSKRDLFANRPQPEP
jgi:NAD(P)-dependent dehydrogenase (short-subunit alcohol dehydrogenase family)